METVTVTAAEAGITTFLLGMVSSWLGLLLFLFVLLAIVTEHNEARGWAVFFALASAVAAYFIFDIALKTLLIGAVVYFVVGLLWSFWRYKREVNRAIQLNKDSGKSEKEYALRKLHPRAMLGTITSWVIIWPFSMVGNLTGDIITVVQATLGKFFRGIYHRIYSRAVEELKFDESK